MAVSSRTAGGCQPLCNNSTSPQVPGPLARCSSSASSTPELPQVNPWSKSWGYSPQPAPEPPACLWTLSRNAATLCARAVTCTRQWCHLNRRCCTSQQQWQAWPKVPVCCKDMFVAQPVRAGHELLPAGCLLPPVLSSPPLPSTGRVYLTALY